MGGANVLVFDNITFDTVFGDEFKPELWALLSYDDMSEATPAWVDVTSDVRAFSTSRGRDSERSEFDAGTASVTLNNRARAYDPNLHTYIRPMNRVQLYMQFDGSTTSIFKGYAESYDQQWPAPGQSDSIAILNAADEFKILGLDTLPVMDPPRDSYADMVGFDNPNNYYRWSDDHLTTTTTVETLETYHWYMRGWESGFEYDTRTSSVAGYQDWIVGNGVNFSSDYANGPIAGDLQSISQGLGGYLVMQATWDIDANATQVFDPDGGSAYTIETWFRKTGNPGSTLSFMHGPESTSAGVMTWHLDLTTTGTVSFVIQDSGAAARTVTTSTALSNDTWYHIAGELDGTTLRIFLNGVAAGTTAVIAGAFRPTLAGGTTAQINGVTGVTELWFDETASYNTTALSATRLLAHYTAGASRGFRGGTVLGLPHLRANQVLDAASSDTPRLIRTCTRGMQPVFQRGQSPVEELKKCAQAEMPNGALFVSQDGTVTLLDAAHRSAIGRWNTTQMTFGDEGTVGQWPYEDLDVDYSDTYIVNEWNASRLGGQLTTSTDATSIAAYGKRSQTLSDLPLTQDADVSTITAALLAKYKDPMQRVLSITLNSQIADDHAVLNGVFRLDLCDRIRIIRTLPPGGSWFDETLYIQKIEVSASNDQAAWSVRLGVSPL